jgi:Zn-dependent protease
MSLGSPTGGGSAYTIGHAFGIPLRVQPMLLLLVAVFVVLSGMGAAQSDGSFLAGALGMLVNMTIVFVSVLLHELGHALAAKRYGVEVVDITLWPLGGIAMLRGMPENSKIEGVVSIMGPVVNLVLAAVAGLLWLATAAGEALSAPRFGALSGVSSLLFFFMGINLMLGAFNLLPAFPMDGGKLLRAYFARRGDWLGATERAVRVGRYAAGVIIVAGILMPNPIVVLIGVYIIFAAWRELAYTRARHGGGGVMGNLGGIMRMAAEMRRRQAEAAREARTTGSGPVHDVPGSSAATDGSGFSEEEIRRLEGFHGRLRRPDAE